MPIYKNGKPVTASDGSVMHCHGAGILEYGGYYYLFGEDRRDRRRVSCYRSKDLVNWEFRNICLSLDSETKRHYVRTDLRLAPKNSGPMTPEEAAAISLQPIGHRGANIERPKVLYCEATGKFVMWMHFENGRDYNAARCAVAVCDTVDGDYVYMGSFNPVGNMSRDCTLYKDDDGTAYFISSARDNADMMIYRLSEDYLTVAEHVKTLWPGQFREAPVLFKENGKYYMLTSRCTGWSPNQSGWAEADAIDGHWSSIRPFGNETTFNTQPTAVVKVGDVWLYIGDRWDPSDYLNSTMVYLPINLENGCSIDWASEVNIDGGKITTFAGDIGELRIMLPGCTDYLGGDGYNVFTKKLAYANTGLLWLVEEKSGCVVLRHKDSGRCLSSEGVLDEYKDGDDRLLWELRDADEGKLFINRRTGKSLLAFGRRVILTDGDDRHFGGYTFVKNY